MNLEHLTELEGGYTRIVVPPQDPGGNYRWKLLDAVGVEIDRGVTQQKSSALRDANQAHQRRRRIIPEWIIAATTTRMGSNILQQLRHMAAIPRNIMPNHTFRR